MTPMNMNKLKNRQTNRQAGFSLIELMTAVVIGILLLTAAVGMFITNNRIYREQNEMGLLQENARFAMSLLVRDIRRAAFVGCADDINKITNNLDNIVDGALINFSVSANNNLIEGSENTNNWQPSNRDTSIFPMATGTDGIAVRYLQSTDVVLTATMASVAAPLTVGTGNGFNQRDFLVVADCGGGDIFRVSNDDADATGAVSHAVTGTLDPDNSVATLSRPYDADTMIYRLVSRRYYIGPGATLQRDELGDPAPDPGGLVDGVEAMQVLYGEDTNGDFVADAYVNASASGVSNWSNVVSVKIALLMRTVSEFGDETDTRTYNLLGTIFDPVDDRRRRRIFTSTVEIRNRKS